MAGLSQALLQSLGKVGARPLNPSAHLPNSRSMRSERRERAQALITPSQSATLLS
jgi:hypothetical protein